MTPIKIVHIITGLNPDGAETMLSRLVASLDPDRFVSEIISLTNLGDLGGTLAAHGVPVRALGFKPKVGSLLKVYRLAQWIREARPHIIQTWMYHADLLGGLAGRASGSHPVIWGIHHSSLAPDGMKAATRAVARACAQLSPWLPRRIVCCSESSRRNHAAFGYAAAKMQVIPNGIDVDVFRPDTECGAEIRKKLRIPPSARIVGLIGRFHPHKDHPCFFRAAAKIARSVPDCHFIVCGTGADRNNRVLVELERESNLIGRCHLLGRQENMQAIYNTLDVLVSSSITEAFPLVLGEAMAAGKPCVATDVGDSRLIAGDTGSIVPAGDCNALARACSDLLQLGSEELVKRGRDGRRRIVDLFSLKAAVQRYQALYVNCALSSNCAPGWLPHSEIDLANSVSDLRVEVKGTLQ